MNKEEIENWKKEFDEISYYQKVKMKDGSYILVCQNSHLIEKIRQLLKYEKEKDRQKFIDALIWCSGSDDFQVGGKARKGWEKICLPLLRDEK